jgi:hypothetical protein
MPLVIANQVNAPRVGRLIRATTMKYLNLLISFPSIMATNVNIIFLIQALLFVKIKKESKGI